MKIGILTQPLHNNYGGLLQNFALQQVLKGMGHEVETVDWKAEYSWFRLKMAHVKYTLLSYVLKDMDKPRYEPTSKELSVLSKNTRRFIERNLSICSKHVGHKEEFGFVDRRFGYDVYVVGSDQVWRPRYNPFITSMFLDFTEQKDVKRISYAASFGTSVWEFSPQLTSKCSELAKRFDLITVREKSGVALCQEHLGVKATWVLDPTMLLTREDYVKLVFAEKEPKSAGTLFHYILDPSEDKRGMIEQLAAELGLKPFTIMPKCQLENRTKWDVKHRIEDCVFPSVASWLRGFMDAKMIIIDSFHGAVFSIIFNKPFWVIANSKRGNARFESLLELFGLENRMIEPGHIVEWKKEIDWQRVNEVWKKEKNRCMELLKATLS